MLRIISEKTEVPEMTLVEAEYNNKKIRLHSYLSGGLKVFGDFTTEEKKNIEIEIEAMKKGY